MSIYENAEQVFKNIFSGLRQDVFDWLIPTLAIALILFLIFGLLYLLYKVLKSFSGNRTFIDNDASIPSDNKKTFKKKKNKLY